ncbi:HNH endonuclease [Bacillus toyonensis]|uniref:HNH endonuclease signature motif containing protein n=1 Tax=Bacillus toyonensis TaxID=155322 RepID=UPI000BED4110|nr:HNH endonuclease signature motif containing protein [Bacillus toyonensis]PEE20761.1 HNH endonuclease [Bacillus toyonensis]
MAHQYTSKQKEFIENNVVGRTSDELTEMFNAHFNLELTVGQIRGFKKRFKLKCGINTRFQKGRVAHNKGKKGLGGGGATRFKKGNKPHNYKPVGTERVNVDGYVEIKIAAPNKWRGKHLVVWEEANGPVPKGHAVIFGDRNRLNFKLNNLILVSKKQLFIMNTNNLIQHDADLTRVGVVIADIHQTIRKRVKEQK